MMKSDPIIDEIRRVRHEISAKYGHDPKKLVAHYQRLQRAFKGKIVNFGAKDKVVLKNLSSHSGEAFTSALDSQ